MRTRVILLLGLAAVLAGPVRAADPEIRSGEQSLPFAAYLEQYERCKAREEFTPPRGEYETQAEYRQRLERLRVGCDRHRLIEGAQLRVPVFLDYQADQQRFMFELPQVDAFRIHYQPLIWDDFPAFLGKLPREKWHVDDPTAKASVYKECQPRRVVLNEAFITRVEPFRADSWRGCMTYYERGEEFAWRRDENTFYIEDVTFHARAPVDRARMLKEQEEQLYFVIEGSLKVPEREFVAQRVRLRNIATGTDFLQLLPE